MTKTILRALLLIGMLGLVPASAGPFEDAEAVRGKWEQAFNSGNWDALAGLYLDDAFYWGAANNDLMVGTNELRAYFATLPQDQTIAMEEPRLLQAGPGVLLSSGFATIAGRNGKFRIRLTLAMANINGNWLIIQHHASFLPRP